MPTPLGLSKREERQLYIKFIKKSIIVVITFDLVLKKDSIQNRKTIVREVCPKSSVIHVIVNRNPNTILSTHEYRI